LAMSPSVRQDKSLICPKASSEDISPFACRSKRSLKRSFTHENLAG
jgi:hypothetical protein